MNPKKLSPLLLIAVAVLPGHAHAAIIGNPTLVSGPGDVIDPTGSETVNLSFGTAQSTLEARSDLRVLQDFAGFTGGDSGNNIVNFTDTGLPDIQFQFSGSFDTTQAGSASNVALFATSGASNFTQRNVGSGTTTSTLTISFGTWNGTSFIADQTVGAAGFTLAQVYTAKSGSVVFRDALGNALNTPFSYVGQDNTDGTGNHRDIYFGWDSAAQSTAEIASISITFVATAFNSGLDDFAFTTVAAPPSSPYFTWAATHAPDQEPDDDFDGDGVPNAVEFVLGGEKDTNELGSLPAVSTSDDIMSFTFIRDRSTVDSSVSLAIETGTDLTTWPDTFTVGADTSGSTGGVTVTDNGDGTDTITLAIPISTVIPKFARLKVVITP